MSNARRSHYIGKRAVSTLLSASMLAAGVTVVNTTVAPAAFAQTQPENGQGSIFLKGTPSAGKEITVIASGLKENTVYNLKIDDSETFEDNQTNEKVTFSNGRLQITSDQDGNIQENIVLPESLTAGEHTIRILGEGTSKLTPKFETGKEIVAPTSGQIVVDEVKVWSGRSLESDLKRAERFVAFNTSAFPAGTEVKATIDGEAVKFSGRSDNDVKTVPESGLFADTAKFGDNVRIGKSHTLTLIDTADESNKFSVDFVLPAPLLALADQQQSALPNSSIGATVNGVLRNLPSQGEVTFIGADGTNFLSAPAQADDGGQLSVSDLKIPNNEALVGKSIVVKVKIEGTEKSFTTPLNVTISNAPLNVDKYTITKADLKSGLYQVVKSDKANSLFVTRANRSAESQLLKVDPETLEVIKSVDLAKIDGQKDDEVNSVFGVDVDDKLGYVWTTNTRSGAVTVFNQDDLSIAKTFPAKTLGHPRDVIVDSETSKAYVTDVSGTNGAIQVFDGNNLDAAPTKLAGVGIDTAVGAAFDPKTGDLFTVPFEAPFKLAKVNVRTGESKTWDLPDGNRTTGVAYDPKTGEAYITNQYSNTLTVFDTKAGKVKENITVGSGVVYALYDQISDRVYVTNRTSGTLSVIDPNTYKIVANIPVGNHPNDVRSDGKGGIYVVNKSSQITDAEVDQIFHITPKENVGDNPGSSFEGNLTIGEKFAKVLGAILGIGLIAAVIGGIINFLKAHFPLPAPAPAPAPELPAKDGHAVNNPVHR